MACVTFAPLDAKRRCVTVRSEAAIGSGAQPDRSVTVAVLTFRRNELIATLLPALIDQVEQVAGAGWDAGILVVDNDPHGGARAVVSPLEKRGVRYVHEKLPGLAAARNRALMESSARNALVFIDDDEVPTPGWLEALLETWQTTGADAVTGPVLSLFDVPPGDWVLASGHFECLSDSTGALRGSFATNNLLLDRRRMADLDLVFDERYGFTGGEDSMMAQSLVAAGGCIVWCNEALVTERVPAARATRDWVLQRAVRQGQSWARVRLDVLPHRRRRGIRRAEFSVRSVARICGLSGSFLLARMRGDTQGAARAEYARAGAWGVLTGALGRQHLEYGRRQ